MTTEIDTAEAANPGLNPGLSLGTGGARGDATVPAPPGSGHAGLTGARSHDRRTQVIRPTLPGHGGAGAVEASFEDAAADLAARVGRAGVWVGYSMGGRFALRVALERPDLVSGLVLLGATPGLADPADRRLRVQRDETLAAGLERKGLDRFLAGWLAQPLFARVPDEAAGLDERHANTVAGLASSLRRHGTGAMAPMWDRLSELSMPVLLMAGEHDTKFVAVAFRMAESIGGASVSLIPGCGHAAHLERPQMVAGLVRRFLAGHVRTSGPPLGRSTGVR